jgi:hypothetical protein
LWSMNAWPITMDCFSGNVSGGMASTGQACPQALQEYRQYPSRKDSTGVKRSDQFMSVTPDWMAPVGQARTQMPHRKQRALKISDSTPGGRSGDIVRE